MTQAAVNSVLPQEVDPGGAAYVHALALCVIVVVLIGLWAVLLRSVDGGLSVPQVDLTGDDQTSPVVDLTHSPTVPSPPQPLYV